MKIKLLKKVRKRYSIEKIEKLSVRPCNILEHYEEYLKLPFYQILDNSGLILGTCCFKHFKDAQYALLEVIIDDYGHQFRAKGAMSKKVWHVNKSC